ncbi:aromatic-ring-hydroxylating dioxygenase subunit beta [Kineobactrum salinum]|uniref:Aromatic-ring-hydroxylating dioxygenase subunit beta n=1 Tax=Kineobactrum salinum TaxID=2708301 RepID=A0A6C0TZ59_9GAMM|nr:aromatic-ring-hydroxylating dioxygenase subunit beta [Kineobactrum salinum]QIB64938.1 aromatic-ring-hydroxylating dioxygenase subunit beta [Kineobactrum salinum]
MNNSSQYTCSPQCELRSELEQFLFHEARCIDEKRWDDWLSLYLEGAIYWVPTDRDQVDPLQQASIVHEDKATLRLRVKRMTHPQAHSLDRRPESTHLISNVMLDKVIEDEYVAYHLSSSFMVLGYQEDLRNTQTVYGGKYFHELARKDGKLKINQKKVILNNCDAPHRNIQVLL